MSSARWIAVCTALLVGVSTASADPIPAEMQSIVSVAPDVATAAEYDELHVPQAWRAMAPTGSVANSNGSSAGGVGGGLMSPEMLQQLIKMMPAMAGAMAPAPSGSSLAQNPDVLIKALEAQNAAQPQGMDPQMTQEMMRSLMGQLGEVKGVGNVTMDDAMAFARERGGENGAHMLQAMLTMMQQKAGAAPTTAPAAAGAVVAGGAARPIAPTVASRADDPALARRCGQAGWHLGAALLPVGALPSAQEQASLGALAQCCTQGRVSALAVEGLAPQGGYSAAGGERENVMRQVRMLVRSCRGSR